MLPDNANVEDSETYIDLMAEWCDQYKVEIWAQGMGELSGRTGIRKRSQ